MNATERLGLGFILPGQAQKEAAHNECLQALDVIVAAAVEEEATDTPPATPLAGACYLIGPAPTGAWMGKAGQLAGFTEAGWRYVAPIDGMTVLVKATGETAAFRDGGWEYGMVRGSALVIGGDQVVGARAAAIADPTAGTQADAEARAAIGAILAALRQHGLIAG